MIIQFDYAELEKKLFIQLAKEYCVDVHKVKAAEIFNVHMEKVTPAMRQIGKAENYCTMYGIGKSHNWKCDSTGRLTMEDK